MCLNCGTVTEWKVESLLLARHWIIFLLLILLKGIGFIYLIIVLLLRSNKDKRAKVCSYCTAKNMWSFIY